MIRWLLRMGFLSSAAVYDPASVPPATGPGASTGGALGLLLTLTQA